MPDEVVADTAEGDLFRVPREADLQRHLSNRQTDAEVKGTVNEPPLADTTKMFTFGAADDFQLQQAINFLDGKPVQKAVARPKTASTTETSGSGTTSK
jgi:carboxyl-terminal processing protease